MARTSGFTLIELMVTITISAILLGIGVPSLAEFVKTNRRAATVNMMVSDLQRARGLAITQRVRVVLCPSSDGATCLAAHTQDWSSGWLLFSDADGNGAPGDAGDQLLNVQAAVKNMKIPANTGRLVFTAGGTANMFGASIAVCADNIDGNARTIILSPTGRPRLVDGAGSLSCT